MYSPQLCRFLRLWHRREPGPGPEGDLEGCWKGVLMRPFSRYPRTDAARPSAGPPRRAARRRATRRRGGVVVGLVLVAAALGGLAPRASADGLPDFSSPGQAWNVLPPGESGSTTPGPHSADQLPLYDGLTSLFDQVTDADLPTYFKPNIFGLGSEEPSSVERPPARPGLHIDRDSKGVAHVFGDTRGDVMYGAGWVTVTDRAPLMELLRGPGRLAAVDAPGIDPFQIALSFRRFTPSAQTEAFLAQQISLLQNLGPAGEQVVTDIDAYLQGINDARSLAGVPGPAWTRNDVVAVAALVGARFGKGGGDEARRAQFLSALQQRLGDGAGRKVFDDRRGQHRRLGRAGRRDRAVRATEREQCAAAGCQPVANGPSAVRCRPAGRLPVPGSALRGRPARRRHRRPRGDLPRIRPIRAARPRAGFLLERHLVRDRYRRSVRRNALRRRHHVRLRGRLPRHDPVRRGDA